MNAVNDPFWLRLCRHAVGYLIAMAAVWFVLPPENVWRWLGQIAAPIALAALLTALIALFFTNNEKFNRPASNFVVLLWVFGALYLVAAWGAHEHDKQASATAEKAIEPAPAQSPIQRAASADLSATRTSAARESKLVTVDQGYVGTGQYRTLSPQIRRLYATALMEGLLLAPVLEASDPQMMWLRSCVGKWPADRPMFMLDAYIAGRPEFDNRGVNTVFFEALAHTCPGKPVF